MTPGQELPDFEPKEPQDNSQDENRASKRPIDQAHISRTFESWRESIDKPISKDDETRMLGIRDAAARGDAEETRRHLESTKTESNWLYEEMMKHPEISAIFRELSIMGF